VTARPSRLPRVLFGLAVALALPLAGCAGQAATAPSESSGSSDSSAAPATSTDRENRRIEVVISGGQVSGDTGRVEVPVGEQVSLIVISDVPGEVHVHGYDLELQLVAGASASITFDATVAGVFEVELDGSDTRLLTLQVE
jgi:plastocyanin